MADLNSDTIFVITGEHPDYCTGGAELQAYLIARSLSEYFNKVFFCTVYSGTSFVRSESKDLIHISLKKEFLPKKVVRFVRYARQFKPGIFYVRCLYSFWWLKIISIFFRIPIIFHISGDSQAKYQVINIKTVPSVFLRNFYLWSTSQASLVIAQSIDQSKIYKKTFGIKPEIVYNAQFPIKTDMQKSYSKIKVLWIGKIFKNPEKFIDLSEAMKLNDIFEFIMVGMLSLDQKKSISERQKNNVNIKYLGQLPREKVYYELENAHVLINTSDSEGFPNTFIEAWQRGVIIISDKINPDNILIRYRIGFICETIVEMKEKLTELFEFKTGVALDYSARAKLYTDEYHNFNKTISQLYRIIGPFLKNNGKSNIS